MKIVILLVILALIAGGGAILFTNWGTRFLVDLMPRPQEPRVRPYVIREVSFSGGADGVRLAGELTMPRGDGPFPALVMITGSGPHNRDEELAGHRPFLVFSDYMTRHGFAVLRTDDRGYGESTGDFQTATTKDFADDAVAALRWLKRQPNIDPVRTGYVGHSEGGYIAPLAAQVEKPAFMVLLAGPAENITTTIVRQNEELARVAGKDEVWIELNLRYLHALFDIMRSAGTPEEAEARWREQFIRYQKELGVSQQELNVAMEATPPAWWMWLVRHDPIPRLKTFDGPVLGVYGGKDLQVSATRNAPLMAAALVHPASKVVTLPNLNHLFQQTKTGSTTEYWWKATTFDEGAMKAIADWLEGLPRDE